MHLKKRVFFFKLKDFKIEREEAKQQKWTQGVKEQSANTELTVSDSEWDSRKWTFPALHLLDVSIYMQ